MSWAAAAATSGHGLHNPYDSRNNTSRPSYYDMMHKEHKKLKKEQLQKTQKQPPVKRAFKVIVIGDANVGKTCLTFRFCNGRFPERTEATIGVDFRERVLHIDGDIIRMQLWDTAGQERFRQSMTAHFYRNVHAIVFVYDVTNRRSFENLTHWITECRANKLSFTTVPALLVGNKCDCKDAVVATNDAQMFADLHNLPLFETSAKDDSEANHVEAIFMTLVHKLKDAKTMALQADSTNVQLDTDDSHQKYSESGQGCC